MDSTVLVELEVLELQLVSQMKVLQNVLRRTFIECVAWRQAPRPQPGGGRRSNTSMHVRLRLAAKLCKQKVFVCRRFT